MKRFLYIIYYWPPCGGISVVRNLKFVKYMRSYGWEPVVYAPENANYPILDPTTFKDIPPNTEVLKTPVTEPFGIFNLLQGKKKDEKVQDVFLVRDKEPGLIHKLGVWVRGNFFVPDARMLWIKPSVKYLLKYLEKNPVDAIISYGPPHTTHRIAYHIHKKTGLPWIADFQDPWTQIDYFEKFMLTNYARNKHKKQEQEVLKSADKVVMVSKSWCNDLAELGGRNVDYIPFGFDDDDFKNAEPKATDKFVISHFGTLGIDRNPSVLWKVLAEIADNDEIFRNDLQITLAGSIDYTIFNEIEERGLKDNLLNLSQLTKDKIIQWMMASGVLLLLLNKGFGEYNVKGRIPAKLFEYLGSRRPILALGETESDVANILNETEAGLIINYEDDEALKSAVIEHYMAWKTKQNLFYPHGISQYNFKALTGKMADLLNQITAK